jgi:hypothetical protein
MFDLRRVRPALEPGGQHECGAGACDALDAAKAAEGVLEVVDRRDAYLDDEGLVAGDPVAGLDLVEDGERFGDVLVVRRVGRVNTDQRRDAEADGAGVHDGVVAGDDTARLELADPLVHGGRRQPDLPSQLGIRRPAVLTERGDDPAVHGVHGRHSSGCRTVSEPADLSLTTSLPSDNRSSTRWSRCNDWRVQFRGPFGGPPD